MIAVDIVTEAAVSERAVKGRMHLAALVVVAR